MMVLVNKLFFQMDKTEPKNRKTELSKSFSPINSQILKNYHFHLDCSLTFQYDYQFVLCHADTWLYY